MLDTLCKRCYWYSMNGDVDKFCKKCQRFNLTKPPHIKILGSSRHLLASKPIEVVAMDFSLLELDSKRFENFLVITAVFNNNTITVSTSNQKATTVVKAPVEIWLLYLGVP